MTDEEFELKMQIIELEGRLSMSVIMIAIGTGLILGTILIKLIQLWG